MLQNLISFAFNFYGVPFSSQSNLHGVKLGGLLLLYEFTYFTLSGCGYIEAD